ncbi:beta-N-acetylhexosaminidase [Sporosarcina sp. YIM B06819]|uniref:beta-N-acetylhexosaminidase n=1 Tax=Sporosarcina sp. YIM B06819 TaxID=3081769 RepID=UPI00298C7BAD|nr:beta-N-acetylhexosaminidase [Sporosarcina sp. YIM B06819]
MNRHGPFLFGIICCLMVLSGCFQSILQGNSKDESDTAPAMTTPLKIEPVIVEPPKIVISPIDEMIDEMTLAEKIGQLLVIGVDGTSFSDEMDNLIRNYHVGGVIMMGRNVSTMQVMLQLMNDMKKANEPNKIPLFMSVDEEGGRVSRLPAGIAKLPASAKIGKQNDETLSYSAGIYLAEVLHEFGYNMNFAPVLDINSNPKNPVIGDRSLGADPELVARLGVATMHGMMDNGIISVVKHFPGHGDSVVDSHKALPKVETTLERLRNVELVPFQRAIDEGADAVMVAHILYPALDRDYPSSMSKAIITGLLRDDMQFDGVVITDDLTMGAIMNDYTIPEAAVQSFIAGSDLLLIVNGYDNQINTVKALMTAIEAGDITEQRLNESVKRILTLKEKYDVSNDTEEQVDVDKINEKYSEFIVK